MPAAKKDRRTGGWMRHVTDPVAALILARLEKRVTALTARVEQISLADRLERHAGLTDLVRMLRGELKGMDRRLRAVENALSGTRGTRPPVEDDERPENIP